MGGIRVVRLRVRGRAVRRTATVLAVASVAAVAGVASPGPFVGRAVTGAGATDLDTALVASVTVPSDAPVPLMALPLLAAQPTPTSSSSSSSTATGSAVGSAVRTDASGIPGRVLQAYQGAAARIAQDDPRCDLPWWVLAGIGKVESGHASGGRVDAAGKTLRHILGPVLDGRLAGTAVIRDSDDGALDGNAAFDRAVGPMQFLPGTWRGWGADADGNGVADPHDIDDAALAAGRYLCAGNADLSSEAGKVSALLRYNRSSAYVRKVLQWGQGYRDGVRSVPGAGGAVAAAPRPSGTPVRPPGVTTTSRTPTATPVPSTPVPRTPMPTTPVPTTPVPTTPVPTTPVPGSPTPAGPSTPPVTASPQPWPAPTWPSPSQPVPTDPTPTDPTPTCPVPTTPVPTTPAPMETPTETPPATGATTAPTATLEPTVDPTSGPGVPTAPADGVPPGCPVPAPTDEPTDQPTGPAASDPVATTQESLPTP
jgi:membrane-bound lytic murein transglycosylase B